MPTIPGEHRQFECVRIARNSCGEIHVENVSVENSALGVIMAVGEPHGWASVIGTTLFCLSCVGSVAYINFIVLALVNISNFLVLVLLWIFIQMCRQKNPHLFFTLDMTVDHFKSD